MTDRNPNAREAEDLLEASMAAHMHLDRLHKAPADNRSQIAAANQRIGISLKMADARATLAVAEEQRRTARVLEGISAALGNLADKLTAALASGVDEDVDCTRCDGPIMLDTFQANDGMCEACKQHVDAEIDALAVSGPHEGEDRA